MHPLPRKTAMGVHGLKVRFTNGSAVLNGYIVKQRSHARFQISAIETSLITIAVNNPGTNLTSGTRLFTVAGGTGVAATFSATVVSGAVVPSSITRVLVGAYTSNPPTTANACVPDSGVSNASFNLTFATQMHIRKFAQTTSAAQDGNLTVSTLATPTTPMIPGNMTMLVQQVDASAGATFAASYGLNAATVSVSGSRYQIGDVLTAASGGMAVTVASLSSTGTVINSIVVSSVGSGLTSGTRTFTVVGGTGTATTFTATVVSGSVVPNSIVISNTGFYSAAPALSNTPTVDTGSTNAVFTLTTSTAGSVATVTVTNPGSYTTQLPNPISLTGGSLGSSATASINATYKVVSVAATGGTRYLPGMTLALSGVGAFAAHITAVDSVGHPTAIVVDTAASGITTFAGAVTKVNGSVPIQHVKKITSKRLQTTEGGGSYCWTVKNNDTALDAVTVPLYS